MYGSIDGWQRVPAGKLWLALAGCAALFFGFAMNGPAALVSSFQAGDGGWHLGTLAVGNLDSEPDLEIVAPYRNSSGQWVLDAFKFSGQRLPGFPYLAGGEEMNVSPTLYDLDGDGRDEIIFTRGNHVIALRGDGSVMWSNTISSGNYVPDGGYQTITNGFYWSDGGAFISRLPTNAIFSSQVSSPIVADITGRGSNVVVTGWKIDPDPSGGFQDFNPFINDIFGSGEWGAVGETWSGGVVFFDARTGQKDFVYHIHQLVESGLAVGRTDTNAPLEVYVLNDSDSVVCFDRTQPHGLWGKGMLRKQFGKNQRLMTGSYQVPIDVQVADIDGDGLDEVLVAGTQLSQNWQPNETILDDDGAILWRRWMPHLSLTNNYGWLNSACLIPINPDHDNHIDVLGFSHSFEISFRYWNGIELVNRPGWPKNFYPYLPTPPVVGDVDGDGQEEIIIGTYNPANTPSDGNLLIYSLDGTLKTTVPVPGGLKHVPTLADVNHDGSLDVVYRSLLGRVYVQNFGATGTNRVSWATHRGNQHRDGNRGVSLYPAGTPMVTQKTSGHEQTHFTWSAMAGAHGYRVYRAAQAGGPFAPIVTLASNVTSYTDYGLALGWQYLYEVGAIYPTNTIHSAPFAILSSLDGNLLANAGFEENDNSHWDKWYTGDIPMTNMLASTNTVFHGKQSMEIRLENEGSNGSIAQFDQYGIPDGSLPVTPGALYSFGGWLKSGGLSQPSEHWLEWGSDKTASDTNNRPALPWPNYFTPHWVIGASATQWTYADRTFVLPAGFPNAQLRHRYTVASPVSGSIYLDDLFFRPLPAPDATNWTVWIPFGETWSYFTETPPSNWTSPNFNDSSWPLGIGKFGAGDGPTNIITPLPQRKPAYYFRTQFVAGAGKLQEFLLAATCTDEYGGTTYPLQIFLNGTELISSGINAVTGQGNEVRYFDLLPFADLILPGTNVIAVKLGNAWQPAWDDVAFDLSLRAIPERSGPPKLTVTKNGGAGMVLSAETPLGSIWRVDTSETLVSWQPVATFTNTVGTRWVLDTGSSGAARFYRLVPN